MARPDIRPPQVEVHGWGDSINPLSTDDCASIEISHSVTPPWHSIRLKLAVPRRHWHLKVPKPGDWIVIRDHAGIAMAFGYVVDRTIGVGGEDPGHVRTDLTSVSAIGWWDLYGLMQTYVAPGLQSRARGTIMSIGQWFRGPWEIIKRSFDSRVSVGRSLARLAQNLGHLRVPPSIADERLGDALRFAYSARTREMYAPERPLEPILGKSLNGLSVGLVKNVSALDLMTSTFVGDRNMVELFPSFELLDDGKSMSKVGRNLGRQPVVVYRMKPYATVSLLEYARWASERNRDGSKTPFQSAAFAGRAWDRGKAARISDDEVIRLQCRQSDRDHVNAVTVGLPMQADSATRFWDKLGLPLYSREAIERRGVRLFQPSWPFFSPNQKASLVSNARAVAGRAWQFMAGADRFERGSLTVKYRGVYDAVRHGQLIDARIPPEVKGVSPASLIAYANATTDTWVVGRDAAWKVRTRIDFSRGLFDELLRDEPFPEAASIGDVSAEEFGLPASKPRRRGRGGGGGGGSVNPAGQLGGGT